MLTLWTALAFATPCGQFDPERLVEDEHFAVTWDEGHGSPEDAAEILRVANEAREVYLDLGWPLTSAQITYRITAPFGGSGAGLTTTVSCEGQDVPYVTLYLDPPIRDEFLTNLVAHELGHAAEYGYTGTYLDGVASWLWWMEGTATWLAYQYDDDDASWQWTADGYNSGFALHQPATALIDPEKNDQLYGTTTFARFLEDQHGADIVRQTWAEAAPDAGSPIWMGDILDQLELDPLATWQDFVLALDAREYTTGRLKKAGSFSDATGVAPEPWAAERWTVDGASGSPALQLSADGGEWILGYTVVNSDNIVRSESVSGPPPLEIQVGKLKSGHKLDAFVSRIDDDDDRTGTLQVIEGSGCQSAPAALWLWLPLLLAFRRSEQ